MTVLVIGASGYLGAHIFKQMKTLEEIVIGTKRKEGTDDGLIQIDLGVRDEHIRIKYLVERFKITTILNLAANDVSPVDRTTDENENTSSFFENLSEVLSTSSDVKLLQIGTSVRPTSEDSYFAAKYKLRNLLENTALKNQIAVLDLPKVVGPGEPLGRFTSNLMHSIITSEKQIVLHPCHKRNFISITQVVKIIGEIIRKWNSGGTEFPSHNAQNLSNYEVSQVILNVVANATHEVLFSHSPVNTGCEVCPADELPLLVRPDFFGSKEISYFLMENEQTVEEALLEQFKTLSLHIRK